MAVNKKSFILYSDIESVLDMMPDEMAGKLFKIIVAYVNDKSPKVDDLSLKLAFEPIKLSLKRDLVKYEEIRGKRAESGKLGGRPIKQTEAKKANGFFGKQTEAKKPVNDNVSVNVNDNVNETTLRVVDRAKKTTHAEFLELLNTDTKIKEDLCISAGTLNWQILKAFAISKANEYRLGGEFDKYPLGLLLKYISKDWKDPTKNSLKSEVHKPNQRPTGKKETR